MSFNFLKGPGNVSFCLARLVGASAAITYPMPYVLNYFKHGVVPEPASFGQGYSMTLGAIGLLIGVKDWALAQYRQACPGGGDAH